MGVWHSASPDRASVFRLTDAGLEVRLKVTPKAASDRLGAAVCDGDGHAMLSVAVSAVPEDGKANKAVIKLLARTWGLRKSDLSIARGATDRYKTLLIERGDAALRDRLAAGIETT